MQKSQKLGASLNRYAVHGHPFGFVLPKVHIDAVRTIPVYNPGA